MPPSPTNTDATLKSSQERLDSRFKESFDDTRGAAPPSSSSSATEKSKDGDASSDIDLEKQESRRANDKKQEDDEQDPNLVVWNGDDDPENPQNWKQWRKWCITVSMGSMTLCVTFASSVFSTATQVTAQQFGVSSEVMTLGTSLFVLGFAFGPLIWGPLSELYGRKIPLFAGFAIFAIFNIPVAVAQNLQTIFVCRFFGGLFASAPLAVVGGALADFWDPVNRGIAIAVFSGATFIGPVLSPVVGGFLTMSYLGWRWTQWITLIMASLFGTIGLFVIPETYAPVLLQRRAKKLRYETKNWALHSQSEESPVDLKTIVEKYMIRPFQMMVMEPILILVTLYMSVIYGIMYLFFSVFPIAFQEYRGWNLGVGGLPFLALIVGVAAGAGLIAYTSKTKFKRTMEEQGHVVPEARLPPMMVGGFVFPAGMFWFAWTSNPNIIWVPQVIACAFIGMGVLLIFLQGMPLHCYGDLSSAEANVYFRLELHCRRLYGEREQRHCCQHVRTKFCGCWFPALRCCNVRAPLSLNICTSLTLQRYHTLGVDWATSTLAFITAALFPVPIIFYYFGERIRAKSRYVPQ